jgi:hypothetical protein
MQLSNVGLGLLLSTTAAIAWAQTQVIPVPAQLRQGAQLILHISGFSPNSLLTVQMDGVTVSLRSDYSDGHGTLNKQLTIPATLTDGQHHIVVTDVYDRRVEAIVTVQGNYSAPAIQLQPNAGLPGVAVAISGTNWERKQHTVTIQSADGRSQDLPAADSCLRGQGCTTGQLYLVVQIPENANPGVYSLIVSDGLTRASAGFQVPQY